MSVQLDDHIASALDRVARERGLSPETLAREALTAYAEDEDVEALLFQAERDIEEGRFVTHDEFMAQLRAMRQRAQEEIARRAKPA